MLDQQRLCPTIGDDTINLDHAELVAGLMAGHELDII